MKDILIISLSTIGFILVLLNSFYVVTCGIVVALVSTLLVFLLKEISLVTKVSSIILTSLSIMIGLSWFIIVRGT